MTRRACSVPSIQIGGPLLAHGRDRGEGDKNRLTQVHRALQQLGITLIAAYSSEARGRSERVFRTLQDRLPQELAQAGITDTVTANQFLCERFVPAYNRRFAVPAMEPGTAFVPWVGASLTNVLCVQKDRVVANDNTVRYQGRQLQIHPTGIGSMMCRPPCEFTRIRMAHWQCFMARDAWHGISRMGE